MPRWLQSLLRSLGLERLVPFPQPVTVSCDPNPASEEVTAYRFTLDNGNPISSPTPSVSMSVPSAGSHTFSVVAVNADGPSDAASVTQTFVGKPSKPVNVKIAKG